MSSKIIWRIDDRLIHGQVIIGWCSQFPIKKLVVCDDEIPNSKWQKELLLMAAPPELSTFVFTPAELAEHIPEWEKEDNTLMILMKSPEIIRKLVNLGVSIQRVNVGGIHFKEGRKEYLPYLYLSDEEAEAFRSLMWQGIEFYCQDLPNSTTYDLKKLLEKKK